MAKSVEDRVRAICMVLPEVTEKVSHGAPSFFVRKQFVMVHTPERHVTKYPVQAEIS